jgi:hypothetical protein
VDASDSKSTTTFPARAAIARQPSSNAEVKIDFMFLS